ncbi:hypothetical protein LX36DRAFT_665061 [Colletotrichum falcatum]|nr:hypothetical protein LX36DRAFT_665061 [Colletotrichum falcatum]
MGSYSEMAEPSYVVKGAVDLLLCLYKCWTEVSNWTAFQQRHRMWQDETLMSLRSLLVDAPETRGFAERELMSRSMGDQAIVLDELLLYSCLFFSGVEAHGVESAEVTELKSIAEELRVKRGLSDAKWKQVAGRFAAPNHFVPEEVDSVQVLIRRSGRFDLLLYSLLEREPVQAREATRPWSKAARMNASVERVGDSLLKELEKPGVVSLSVSCNQCKATREASVAFP